MAASPRPGMKTALFGTVGQALRVVSRHGKTLLLVCGTLLASSPAAWAIRLDELSLDRWGQLREAERYQLNIAEEYFTQQNWKVALAEYEKFLSLYEDSEGAPYAQLKWSLCQIQLRKLNTAIKDGFQSILDYWPDTPEAVSSLYFIARTYKDMGELPSAKKAYAQLLSEYPDHLAAVMGKLDLIDIARVEDDVDRRVQLWRDLTFDTERTPDAAPHCAEASRQLAIFRLGEGSFQEAQSALATTYTAEELPYYLDVYARSPLQQMNQVELSRPQAHRLADDIIGFIREQMPTDLQDAALRARAKQYWFYIADVQSHAGRTEEVDKVYEQMLQAFGQEDDILGGLASWLRSTQRRPEARRVYARFTNQIEGTAQLAWMDREEQQWDQALQLYQGLLSQDVDHVDRWQWEIANTNRDAGRYQDAIAAYRQCENFPDNVQQMAWCYRQLGEFQEALVLYNQIVVSREDYAPWAALQIAYVYEAAQDKEAAIKAFQNVCKKYPKSPYASEAHVHLNEVYSITFTLGGSTEDE